ncbi:MAG TPA: LuxR C-terminal-related transcriptional regulator [Microbacterium sp.]|uniref:LuxR C-terminal-related transcriptional regulator n=1 Tax=Microbacterium sp. TaxID=51671 RepID=UPI002CCEBD03|nr:LuxR C-terminal-related transcriptional regulator [Microbacterium sp.]HWI30587.1 LuxR C-terminal-related transcriptional regulator [Microbacterium sp.]
MRSVQRLEVGIPRVPGDVISRPRLTAALETGGPLTLVRGACGSGKTVAIREWVRHTANSVVWTTVDADTATSGQLAATLVRQLSRAGLGQPEAPELSGWAAVRASLESLDAPLTIVIDDAASLHHDALLDLCRLIADVASLRVVVAANRRTVLDGDAVGLLIDRTLVGPSHLMFDDDEIRRALGVETAVATEVQAITNGFAAVIHAMARLGSPALGESLLDVAVDAVEEYMRVRVARSGYDTAVLDTLMLVGFADAVDVPLARELSGNPRVERHLDSAEHLGFGAWSDEGSRRLFRFAPFAHVLLRRELERTHADDLPRLRRTLVEHALRADGPIAALTQSVEWDDLDLASRVVIASWHHLITNDGAAVCDLLGAIPLSRLRHHALLVMLLALCYNSRRVRRLRGLQLFRVAVSAANSPRPDMTDSDRLFVWTSESVALRLIGMSDRAGSVAMRALRLLTAIPEDERAWYADELPLLCAQLGVSLHYSGHRRQAIECFIYGAALAETGQREHGLTSLAMLGGIHALEGDIPEARYYVDLIRRRRWPKERLDGYQGTFYRVAEALIALEESDPVRAAEHIEVFGPHRATSEHWLAMATVEALVALRAGRAAAGLARLESFVLLRGREGHNAASRRALTRVRVLLHLALGDTHTAKAVLHRDAPEDRFETVVERARVALVEDRPGDTVRILSQTRIAPTTPRLRAAAAALRAAALHRTGGASAAEGETRALAAQLLDRQLRLPLTFLPPADIHALRELFPEEASELRSVQSALTDRTPPPDLSTRERVVLRALASGVPVSAIAAQLSVSPNTVKTQLKSIYRKLGVTGRDEAIAVAVAKRLLSDPP